VIIGRISLKGVRSNLFNHVYGLGDGVRLAQIRVRLLYQSDNMHRGDASPVTSDEVVAVYLDDGAV
jgi:hypothetical protein